MSRPNAADNARLDHIRKYGPIRRIATYNKREPWKFMTGDGMVVRPCDFHNMLIRGEIRAVAHCGKIMGLPVEYEVVG